MSREALLEIAGLNAHFARRGRLDPALLDIELRVEAGRSMAITGESGSGKSTLARALVGLVTGQPGVTSGSWRWRGQQVLRDCPRSRQPLDRQWRSFLQHAWRQCYRQRVGRLRGREIFFIPQDPRAALAPTATVAQQLTECLRHLVRPARLAVAAECLERFALARELLQRYPHELSTGQCQRVLMAMALALPAPLVVADEPLAKLDPSLRASAIAALAALKAHDRQLIVLTHQLDVIRQLADETIVLFAGRIVEHGPTMRVMGDSAGHPYTQELLRAHADPGRSRPLELAAVPAVGCAYALRCDRALEARCTSALPPLTAGESATHAVRCWWQVPPTSPASATQRPVDPS